MTTGGADISTNGSGEERRVDFVALHLPQFHPIPVNDAAWGTGFTEWTSVRRGRRLFPWHYQPHRPGELGWYDLRSSETRSTQTRMAADAGLSAFCFYHYWFEGDRPMGEVIDAFFEEDHPIPFMFCWANHSWTRQWTGDRTVILEQRYTSADDSHHARWMAEIMSSDRYFKAKGRPVLLVYDGSVMADQSRFVALLREACHRLGVANPLVGACLNFDEPPDFAQWPFDFAMNWSPNFMLVFSADDRILKAGSPD